jgi:hypothetical protein
MALALRLIAKSALEELIRSHGLPLPGSSPIAAYQVRACAGTSVSLNAGRDSCGAVQLTLASELSATLSREAITSNDLGKLGETQATLRELAECGWLLERSLLTAVEHQLNWAEP